MITRKNGEVEMPRGGLVLHPGDVMLLACDEAEYDAIWRQLVR